MKNRSPRNAFEEGRASIKQAPLANPYPSESNEHRNFELGRAYGVRMTKTPADEWMRQRA